MRIALLSDIHGNLAALESVAADIRRRGADRIVCLGDLLSGPLLPLETAQYLMAEGWFTLAGNHERQVLDDSQPRAPSDAYTYAQLGEREFSWLRTLSHRARLTDEVFLCHGIPGSDNENFLETVENHAARLASLDEIDLRMGDERSALVACGHTHVARAVRSRRGQLVVNPGSVGQPAYTDTHPMPHAIQTGSPDARYAIIEKTADGWVARLMSVPYDYRPMAALARARHRPEWEQALLTGYVTPAPATG